MGLKNNKKKSNKKFVNAGHKRVELKFFYKEFWVKKGKDRKGVCVSTIETNKIQLYLLTYYPHLNIDRDWDFLYTISDIGNFLCVLMSEGWVGGFFKDRSVTDILRVRDKEKGTQKIKFD